MPREEKKRIAMDGPQQPLAGLEGTFAGLTLPPLPAGSDVPSGPAPAEPQPIWKMGRVVLRRETAHRGGKCVIVVHGFATHLPVSVLEMIARKIRQGCGCGGAVKGRTIEVQGDQPGRVRGVLEQEGFQVAGVK